MENLNVLGAKVRIDKEGYINITDIAKFKSKEPDQVIRNWLRLIYTIEFMAEWEALNNKSFNPVEYDRIRAEAGTTAFTLSVKQWKELTGAVGITAKAGRYGGTYAHNEIAFEFCTAISPAFKLNLIIQWRELKGLDSSQKIRRELSKVNHLLLTSAISEQIPPQLVGTKKAGIYFSSEMDLLNTVVFGMTAQQWKKANPTAKGNMRDHAEPLELLILSNLEAINAYLIKWDTDQQQRLELLTEIANHQRNVLPESKAAQRLIKKGKRSQKK
ncbi:MAG: KilA-N domain-containing protein [Bacteroidota bacterium]